MKGLSPEGFTAKRLPEIKEELEDSLVEAFGDPDLREESVYGQLVGISSELAALLWSLSEQVYGSQYPDTATGNNLDLVCALNGVVRIPETPTQVTAIAYGAATTILPTGREAKNPRTGDVYRSTEDVTVSLGIARFVRLELDNTADGAFTVTLSGTPYTFTASGSTEQQILTGLASALSGADVTTEVLTGALTVASKIPVTVALTDNISAPEIGVEMPMLAVEPGEKLLPISNLTEIVTPVSGWARIDNLQPGITGTDRETDTQLRARRERSIRITGRQTIPAIQSRLQALPLVQDVLVTDNNTSTTDANGTLPQHVWAVVEGGEPDDIARVLFNTVAAGVGYRGDVDVDVVSEDTGKSYGIKFDRPTNVDPDISIEYVRLSNFPPDGEDRIKDALVARTYNIGEKLVSSRLYTPVNTVEGVQVDLLSVDDGASLDVSRIEPAPNERIRILAENITLTDVT